MTNEEVHKELFDRFMMYDTPLTSAEIAANYAADKARFGLP